MYNYNNHIVIIGAGISGAVLAERYASMGKKVLVLEKRGHLAGNCYDYYNSEGILVSKYGAHLFHTNFEDVWEYVNRFSKWFKYEHKVLAKVDGKLVPIPVNITTVNKLFNLSIETEGEMKQWLNSVQVKNDNPKNGEEAALARVGKVLYEKMFKYYTKKQWARWPSELDASVLQRIPVRTNFDDRYFSDVHQALPKGGYTQMFENIFSHPNITALCGVDFFDVRRDVEGKCEKLFYTGPIDRFFGFKHSTDKDKLEWRSIKFEWKTIYKEYFQENSVINYPQMEDGKFTRVIEYKHFTQPQFSVNKGSSQVFINDSNNNQDTSKTGAGQAGQKAPVTTICREYSTNEGEPYYPVPNPKNDAIFQKYRQEADKLTNIYFVGRLANYKYFNMDQAFKNALDLFYQLEGATINKLVAEKPVLKSLFTFNQPKLSL